MVLNVYLFRKRAFLLTVDGLNSIDATVTLAKQKQTKNGV